MSENRHPTNDASAGFDPVQHPHRRFNPLTGRWVIVSAHRTQRPWSGQQEAAAPAAAPSHDPGCYLCAGNRRAHGEVNPPYAGTYVFDNDFPALLPRAAVPPQAGDGSLLQAAPVSGRCRVLCFSPDHGMTLSRMPLEGIEAVVDAWAAQSRELGARHAHVQVFENRGAMMGCSSPHPHGQIWATDHVPGEVAVEDTQQRAHLAARGTPLLLDYAAQERAGDRARVVIDDPHWLVVVPWWANWPFETLLLPTAHTARLEDIAPPARAALARVLQRLTQAFDALFDTPFPYSMGWHGAPHGNANDTAGGTAHWQLHAHFYPPLLRSATVRKFMAGYELLGDPQRDLTPEQAAERLRTVLPSAAGGSAAQPGSTSAASAGPVDAGPAGGTDRSASSDPTPAATPTTTPATTTPTTVAAVHVLHTADADAAGPDTRRNALRARVDAAFQQQFGTAPTLHVRAPGRVNLIGEHTDYSDGFCLPCAIDRETLIALRPTGDQRFTVLACDEGGAVDSFALDAPITRRPDAADTAGWGWTDYVRGTVHALLQAGLAPGGAQMAMAGNVPLGAGLSSSAALEMAVASACEALADQTLPLGAKARAGQLAEHRFAGCQCGILDQLASAGGRRGHALLLDCRSQQTQAIPLPRGTAVLVVHSHVQRGLVDSAYNLRRAQCSEAAQLLGVPMLRDVDAALWAAKAGTLPPELLRRARHVVTENQRTLQAATALQAGDLHAMGALMAASHRSMRDDFDIVPPEVDALATLLHNAVAAGGAGGGARMTGGGFGGCVVALAPLERVQAVREAVAAGYRGPDGSVPEVWVCEASDGAGVLA